MREILEQSQGMKVDIPTYFVEFDRAFWRIGSAGFWKLECRQDYQETKSASWEAFRRGDWSGSLRLFHEQRSEFEAYYARISAVGFLHHRARVVEEPVTPYLQWELHLLQTKDQYGEGVSILTTDRLAALGVTAPLPDVVVLGREVAYEVHYTDQGQLDGATRHSARAVVDDARAFIQRLHGDGEPLASYFPRAIAGLRPPNQPEPDA
ncbi:DUF6879 family protein [Streptacidiphilus carbonis]|uniref:DUF6879 family protein n=1 Tax=Streptacidiphilus carbonis TaxID=105422 RepID=UPI0005A837A1|nr:DUF6879 family protein [Streptacidiphilus carbonis]